MYKILAICGESCSGKDRLLSHIAQMKKDKINKKITCTTRPEREQELNDYIFLSKKEFVDKLMNNEFIECSVIESNSEGYGTLLSTLSTEKVNVGIYNLEGIEILEEDKRVKLQIVYIKADDKIRFKRQIDRDNDKSIEELYHRFELDKKEFRFLDLRPDIIIVKNNNEAEFEEALRIVDKLIDEMGKNY